MRSLPIILIAIGIFLRLNHYFDNLSFWADEAWVAVDIASRTIKDIVFSQNINPHFSVLPVGFLLVEKTIITLLGENEYMFRLFPLLCGILALFLYHRLLKMKFSLRVMCMALALFVFLDRLIFYSAELKQYSSDVLFVIILYIANFSFESKMPKKLDLLLFAAIGVIAFCFSYPALFILAGLGLTQVVCWCVNKKDNCSKQYLFTYSIWATGYFLLWFFYFSRFFQITRLVGYHQRNFIPLPLWSIDCLEWLGMKSLAVFDNPMGLTPNIVAVGVFIAGIIALYRKNKKLLFQLITPLFLALTAAGFKKYPFFGRFLLFAAPAIVIIIAEGIEFILSKNKLMFTMGVVILGVILMHPLQQAVHHIIHPREIAEIRPLINYLKAKQMPGDHIYLNSAAQYAYRYYTYHNRFSFLPYTTGIISDKIRNDEKGSFSLVFHRAEGFDSKVYSGGELLPGKVNPDKHNMRELRLGHRTWVLFTQVEPVLENHFLECFNNSGKKINELKRSGASLYLYE